MVKVWLAPLLTVTTPVGDIDPFAPAVAAIVKVDGGGGIYGPPATKIWSLLVGGLTRLVAPEVKATKLPLPLTLGKAL